MKTVLHRLFLFVSLLGMLSTDGMRARAALPDAEPLAGPTAYDLIIAMNTLRVSNGLPALIEDPIVNAVAQGTAEIMAANQMSWHIGDVRGRIQAAGYGGGAQVWATENFAVGTSITIDQIMVMWSDEAHMIPAVKPAYCHVGAGVAKAANGMTYYVLQAAYTATSSCGPYNPPAGSTAQPGGIPVPQLIVPVRIATPDADGIVYHVVETGQSLWAIAVAYHVTIQDLETYNNLTRDAPLRVDQKLFIPSGSTAGYATPTPPGMFMPSTPDAEGRIVHTVSSHQTLTMISQGYDVTVDSILALNGLQVDWPLQIGQQLMISPGNVTPTPTPRPLTPIERLTPESDGRYYHTIQSGESLSWIAGLYNVSVADLMAWNGLNNASIIQPNQKLLLQVTPPATITPTPAPPTETSTTTPTPRPPTATRTATQILPSSTPAPVPAPTGGGFAYALPILALFVVVGLVLMGVIGRRRG